MRKYLRKTVTIILLIVAIVIGGTSCRKEEPTSAISPAKQNTSSSKESSQKLKGLISEGERTITVTAAAPARIVESPGKIVFPDKIKMHFETAGTIESVNVDEAVRVRKGDPMISLDSVTVVTLQKQVAAARVALDKAEEALKDEKELYIPADLVARQARVAQLQKDLYILQQILDDSQKLYKDKAKDLLDIDVPLALLNQPPEQLVAVLLAQVGVKPFWGAFQDHVRPKLEKHWEQLNSLQNQDLRLQQTLRNLQQQKDDLTGGHSETKAQSAIQIIQRKNELTLRQRENALLQRDSALVQLDQVRIAYRNQIRDLLGFTVPREIGNGFYLHLQRSAESPIQVLEEELASHIKPILGMSLDSQELSSLPPDKLVGRLLVSSEGQDHILDFFLRQKLQGGWLSLSQARQKQHERNTTRDQVFGQYLRALTQGGSDETAPWRKLFRDTQVAEIELQTANQARDQALITYKQLFRNYLNIDMDSVPQIIPEEQAPELLFKVLRTSITITDRLQQELIETLRTARSAIQQTEISILKAETTIQEADLSIQEAKETLRQAQNTLNDLTTKTTRRQLEAQEQMALVQAQQVQDKVKKTGEDYQKVIEDYLNISLKGKIPDQPPAVLLQNISPGDMPGFRKFIKDVVLEAQGPWGQLLQAREQSGIVERALKKAREDLDDAKKGPDLLLIALKESEIAQARKEYDDAQRKFDRAILRAPFDGIISRVLVDPDDYVKSHETVLEMINPNKVEIEAILDELDVVRLTPGMTVKIKLDAYPDRILAGNLTSVEPLSQTSGFAIQFRARVKFEANPNLPLYENMNAYLTFQ